MPQLYSAGQPLVQDRQIETSTKTCLLQVVLPLDLHTKLCSQQHHETGLILVCAGFVTYRTVHQTLHLSCTGLFTLLPMKRPVSFALWTCVIACLLHKLALPLDLHTGLFTAPPVRRPVGQQLQHWREHLPLRTRLSAGKLRRWG
jgi:hypothetical protein